MGKLDPRMVQQRIDEIQSAYREWLQLQPQLEAAQQQWRRAETLMQRMTGFYDGEYREYFEAVEQGLPVSLKTGGEYSVLSEDALFDAMGCHRHLAMAWLRLAVKALDPDGGEG